MEIKDLMVNDWYQWYADGKYYQYQVKAEDFTKDYVTNFEPIRLTPEILKKNGFYKDWDNKTWLMGELFKLKPNYIGGFTLNKQQAMNIIYVHRLQQILRAYGMRDLADNFKV